MPTYIEDKFGQISMYVPYKRHIVPGHDRSGYGLL